MDSDLKTALRIRSLLNQGVATLDQGTADRLRAARSRALAQYRPQRGLQLAGAGGWRWSALAPGRNAFIALGLVTIAVAVGASYYWNQYQKSDELEGIDSALLADELPPEAYLDKGFFEWLDQGGVAPAKAAPSAAVPHT